MEHPILDAALDYAKLGYRVIPLKPGSKIPALRHWPEEASSDPGVVREHFVAAHGADPLGVEPNVGIVTGAGLAVLDIDTHHDGELPLWAVPTLTVRTASGGLHLYYAVDRPVPNSVGRLGRGIDVRGERGQVAAPPSVIHTEYREYDEVIERTATKTRTGIYKLINDVPIARIDAELLIPEDERQDFSGRRGRRFEYRDEVPVGERNNYLTALAGYLYANGEGSQDVLEAITLESHRLGFTPSRENELLKIVRSVSRYH